MTRNFQQQILLKNRQGSRGRSPRWGCGGKAPDKKPNKRGSRGTESPGGGEGAEPQQKTIITFFKVSFVDGHERKSPKIFSFSYKLM